jgi:predicted transcriptional regulator of viral defense system
VNKLDFFDQHPVFTREEFLAGSGVRAGTSTAANLLLHHAARGRIVQVRKGLYATVPRGIEAASASIDPYLLASRLAPDAVVALHAALQLRGYTYSVWTRFHYVTRLRRLPLTFRGARFVAVTATRSTRPPGETGVVQERHAGGTVRVTTLEQTLVDLLRSPRLGGGWEEVWRSLEMVPFFDLDAVASHALALGSALTVGRVGYFLEQHRESLMAEERHLAPLRARAPRQVRYFDARHSPGTLVPGWNLIVPHDVQGRTWAEVP